MAETSSTILELRRVIEATPAEVFDALTQVESVSDWWCPEGYCAHHVEIDLRPGGVYRIEMRSETDADVVNVRGEYREISPPNRLVFTHLFEEGAGLHTDAGPLTDAGLIGHETLVTIEVKQLETATELILTQEQLPSAQALKMLSGGWRGMLKKLERVVHSK